MRKTIVNENASIAVLPHAKAVVSIIPNKENPKPIQKIIGIGDIAPWGDLNTFPQLAYDDAYKSTIIPPVLEWKAQALYSGGLVYGTVKIDSNTGEERLTPLSDDYINEWLDLVNITRYLIKSCNDFYWFYNPFPVLILSKDRNTIANISAQEAMYSRWGKQNPANGNAIEKLYINANWGNGGNQENSYVIPVLDVDYDGVSKLKSRSDSFIYSYPISYPTPGRTYYQVAAWETLRKSGWLDVAISIPEFKKYLMKNQITLKYHIEVSMAWWTWKYPDFESYTAVKRREVMQDELDKFNDIVTGNTNAGRSIMSVFQQDPHTMKEYAGWRINTINETIKDGAYIEDSQEASSHHYSALGVDPTLLGNAPGKGMGAGSGSDKRVAFNIYVNGLKTHQDLILEPLRFISKFNGWTKKYPGLTFWFRNYWISTLDSGAQVKSVNSSTPA